MCRKVSGNMSELTCSQHPRKAESKELKELQSWQKSSQGQRMKKSRESLPAFKVRGNTSNIFELNATGATRIVFWYYYVLLFLFFYCIDD